MGSLPTLSDRQRFERFSIPEPNTGCWIWLGKIATRTGYGHFWISGRTELAHRISHVIFRGEIRPLYEIDHTCRNKWCVNPDHLEEVTSKENCIRRTVLIRACPLGHPYDDRNTYITARGYRVCRRCGAIRMRQRRAMVGMDT
jgi:hypothetical protein